MWVGLSGSWDRQHLLHDKLTLKYHFSNNHYLPSTSCSLSQAQHISWTVSYICYFASSLRRVTKRKGTSFCLPHHFAGSQYIGQIRRANQFHRGRDLASDLWRSDLQGIHRWQVCDDGVGNRHCHFWNLPQALCFFFQLIRWCLHYKDTC